MKEIWFCHILLISAFYDKSVGKLLNWWHPYYFDQVMWKKSVWDNLRQNLCLYLYNYMHATLCFNKLYQFFFFLKKLLVYYIKHFLWNFFNYLISFLMAKNWESHAEYGWLLIMTSLVRCIRIKNLYSSFLPLLKLQRSSCLYSVKMKFYRASIVCTGIT